MTKPRRSQLTSPLAAPRSAPEPQQTTPAQTKPAQEPTPAPGNRQGRKKNASVYLTPGDYQRATLAMQLYGRREGYRGLSDLGARLIMAEVERIEAEHNGGRRLDEYNPLDHI